MLAQVELAKFRSNIDDEFERPVEPLDCLEPLQYHLLAAKIGREITVLVDAVDDEGTMARSSADAPEIDGLVMLNDFHDCEPGDFLRVRIVDADEHDLYAEPIYEDE